jgi:diguanylate cyclase (GGDEF)-like protein
VATRKPPLLLVPIHVEGCLAAVLAAGYEERVPSGAEDDSVLGELADRVGVALSYAAWEEKLQHLAYHDPLTGLPNRLLLEDRLNQALARAQRSHGRIALILIDLDRFKRVNDSLGHQSGDALLRHLAQALAGKLRSEDTLARLGGDEFVALLTDLDEDHNGSKEASIVARKLQAAAATPFRIREREIRPSASLGIALYPHDGTDAESLLKNADAAMYHAKELGRGNCQFYRRDFNEQALRRLDLEADLHHALDKGEFLLHFQPKVATGSRTMAGVEALVRWKHPEKGMIRPGEFIELAEETGIIVRLGQWILNQGCLQAMALARLGFEHLTMAVNLSPRQFRDADLIEQVRTALAVSGLAPEMLELEITESSAVENLEHALSQMRGFRDLGVRLAIDDFGVGYASLSYMKHFPVSTLKIDRSFISSIESEPKDAAIVAAIIILAHELGLKVVAEGVENEAQFRLLEARECDQIQGYFFSRPVPFEELVHLLHGERQPESGGSQAAALPG